MPIRQFGRDEFRPALRLLAQGGLGERAVGQLQPIALGPPDRALTWNAAETAERQDSAAGFIGLRRPQSAIRKRCRLGQGGCAAQVIRIQVVVQIPK